MPSAPASSVRVQLAGTDEAATRGRELEGCALHCGTGSEATLAAAKPIAGPRTLVLDSKTVAEALSGSHGPEWENALLTEVGSCLELRVWEDCELPPGKQALPSHFIKERKRDERNKVRLVAGEHRQQNSLDFEETYAPVLSSDNAHDHGGERSRRFGDAAV
jgi:hypothetical protein